MTYTDKTYEEAKLVAIKAHSNQSYDEIFPYHKHLQDVVDVIKRFGYSGKYIVAAWLHDAIEDDGISYNDIKKHFGIEVAEMVFCVTDELGRNRKEKKRKLYLKQLATQMRLFLSWLIELQTSNTVVKLTCMPRNTRSSKVLCTLTHQLLPNQCGNIWKNYWEKVWRIKNIFFMKGCTKENYGSLTYDKCKEIALMFKSKPELVKNNGSVHNKIRKKGWLELFDHMDTLQKPNGFWNYERCKEEALKHTTRIDLQKNNSTVYRVIRENNWLELFNHMEYIVRPSGYWTYDLCKEEALKHTTRVDLQKNNSTVYTNIRKNGWLELFDHMEYIVRPSGYWSFERCHELILKYDNWKDFINENQAAYSAISKNKWQKELGPHMKYTFKPNNYWTYDLCKVTASKYNSVNEIRNSDDSCAYIRIKKEGWNELIEHFIETIKPAGYWGYENCKEEALKYKTRKDLAANSMVAYQNIRKNKWFELLEHMSFQDNIKIRYIYVFEFDNNAAYVGLTWNPKKRKLDHLTNTNSRIYKYLQEHDVKYEFKVISDKLTENEAQKEEAKKITEYKDNGWVILNRASAGGLGSMHVKWNYNTIKKIVDTCTKISEMYAKLPSHAITRMRKDGFYDEMTKGLIYDVKPPGYWYDKERCRECASNFKYKSQLQKAYSGVYKACLKFGWLDEFFKNKKEQVFDEWNDKEKCHHIALKFKNKSGFRNKHRYIYNLSEKNGWLDEITSHMQKPQLTYEHCKEEALKFTGRYNFQKGSVSAYGLSYRKGWLDEFFPKNIKIN